MYETVSPGKVSLKTIGRNDIDIRSSLDIALLHELQVLLQTSLHVV